MKRLPAALLAVTVLLLAPPAGASYPVSYLFETAILAQTLTPDGPPPGANDWSCVPSAAHPRPVVLVHGLLANKTVNWQTMSPLLANHGYCVFALTYGTKPGVSTPFYQPGGLKRMEDSAQELSAFIDQVLAATGASKVDIVGHSEGTLMPDWYVKFLGGAAKVDHYVSVASLWHGTNLAGLASIEQIGGAFGLSPAAISLVESACESCPQFLKGSDFLRKLRKGGVAVPGVSYTNIVTRNDELVVPYRSGIQRARNMKNFVVQQQCVLDQSEHLSIISDPITAADILNALDPEHPVDPPCTPVLPFVGAPLFVGPQ